MPEAQAKSSWTPPTGTLGDIVAQAFERAALLERDGRNWRAEAELVPRRASLREALVGRETVAVIAEVKRRSPSNGVINVGLNAGAQARWYETGGAAAISVLTEPTYFGGSADDIRVVHAAVAAPTLKKDFHVAPVQLYEARALGASAALLIARALEPDVLRDLIALSNDIDLETLVEVRDEDELGRALDAGAKIVGVNNRDLETLVIHEGTAERVIAAIPAGVIAVAESGMRSRADVERAAAAGADAVLVGSAVSAASDPTAAVAELTVVAKRPGLRQP